MVNFLYNNWPVLFLTGAVLIALVLAKLILGNEKMPYQKRASLLTKSEFDFFKALDKAVDGKWAIQSMVRMADLIRVAPKTPKFQSWQNRIHAKHIDFLLCDHGSMEVKLAVELDDKSHQRADRINRDRFVNQALADAGLPLMRIDVQDHYDATKLRKSIDEHLGK